MSPVTDYAVEEMLPVETWGKQFVATYSPGSSVPDIYKFVAAQDNTVISIPRQTNVGVLYSHLNDTD